MKKNTNNSAIVVIRIAGRRARIKLTPQYICGVRCGLSANITKLFRNWVNKSVVSATLYQDGHISVVIKGKKLLVASEAIPTIDCWWVPTSIAEIAAM